ncbi:MAG: hypothetical protein M3Y79_09315 [Pseudomonadota bacterium]|nr:hypothetical protein [Pseudomonadota bacterium]
MGDHLSTPGSRAAWRGIAAATVLALLPALAGAAEDGAAVSTINHAFATELGTGVYDMGGRNIFVVRVTPTYELRVAREGRPGLRLVAPIAAGSFDFNPFDSIEADVPDRVDSFSLMPGVEADFLQGNDWILTPWLRVGGSFSDGQSDGLLYGAGARLAWQGEKGNVEMQRLHELSLVSIDYSAAIPDDRFLRLRNALDLRQQFFRVTPTRRLMASLYAIVDIVPDPPELPEDAGEQSVVQLELGFTLNAEPRPRISRWRWPRLGFGYRVAGDFSGWRIVIGAPF